MPTSVYVKVVGFTDVERHALNTLFRLSQGQAATYLLWTADLTVPPHMALIDVDSYEAGLELASPGFNPNLKMICIGSGAPAKAWRSFPRPIQWPQVVRAMDELFAPPQGLDIDVGFGDTLANMVPPGIKVTLIVDPSRDERFYLRARLALSGLLEVDEAVSAEQALELAGRRHYDLVLVSMDLPDMDGWKLIEQLVALDPPIGCVVMSTMDPSWQMRERAEQAGCHGLLVKPYDPTQVVSLLQKV